MDERREWVKETAESSSGVERKPIATEYVNQSKDSTQNRLLGNFTAVHGTKRHSQTLDNAPEAPMLVSKIPERLRNAMSNQSIH